LIAAVDPFPDWQVVEAANGLSGRLEEHISGAPGGE
jgi:hypothetical protein